MRHLLAALAHPRGRSWGLRPWRLHSLVLTVAGLAYIAYGVLFIFTQVSHARNLALEAATTLVHPDVLGGAWVAVGVLSIVSSRWPTASEMWGYALLAGLASAWGVCYLGGVALLDAAPSSGSGAISWGLLAFVWAMIPRLTTAAALAALADLADSAQASRE